MERVTTHDARTRFVGLCEFEALLWDAPALAPPGRIGRRRPGSAVRPPPDWRQERRMWRQLRAERSPDRE
jgi:hypothetical protein